MTPALCSASSLTPLTPWSQPLGYLSSSPHGRALLPQGLCSSCPSTYSALLPNSCLFLCLGPTATFKKGQQECYMIYKDG